MAATFWNNLAKPIMGLAPMDGITDTAFRQMVLRHSQPSVVFTEFTTVEGLKHGALKPLQPFIYAQSEHPIIAQIFGTDPEGFYQASLIIAALGFDGIDINMGCPSKSVSGHGAGAGLIRTPRLAQEIIRACRRAAQDFADGLELSDRGIHPTILQQVAEMHRLRQNIDIDSRRRKEQPHKKPLQPATPGKKLPSPKARPLLPVSVKTRLGYDKVITREWLKYLLEEAPDNITLHGRTLTQMYGGAADWEEIAIGAEMTHRERPNTTFLGNGDIENRADLLQKVAQYDLDGALIGRASFGNPWIFSDYEPTHLERLGAALEHAVLYQKIYGQNPKAFAPMKKHLGWYCKGFIGAKDLRMELMTANSAQNVKTILERHSLSNS